MLSIGDKIILCDMSNFTLGVDISIIEKQKVVNTINSRDLDAAMNIVHNLCQTQNIKNVFIKPLALANTEKVVSEFKAYGKTNFSKTFDKIHYHVV